MKADLYTKSILTVIAVMLAVIACNQYANPNASVQAQSSLSGVQFMGVPNAFMAIDTRTGEVWEYSPKADHLGVVTALVPVRHGKVTKLGAEIPAPLVK